MYFTIFIFFFIFQRLSELLIAWNNEKWLLQQGAVEYGKSHYPYIVCLHSFFIAALIAEYHYRGGPSMEPVFLAIFILLLLFKFWVISSLGKYWNTKIYRVPGTQPVVKGPFKFLRHPNYVEVVCEIAVIPLIFNLYYTAIIFTILNAIMLTIRIKVENKVWSQQ